MKVITIRTSASTGFNDPYEQFRNHRVEAELTAELSENEDPESALVALHGKAHAACNRQRASILQRRKLELELASVQRAAEQELRHLNAAEQAQRNAAEAETSLAESNQKAASLLAQIDALGGWVPKGIGSLRDTNYAGHDDSHYEDVP